MTNGLTVRFLVFGYNAWDVLVPMEHWPRADTKCEVDVIREGGGGPGATAAVALARLGATVRFVTSLGDDRATAGQVAELEAAGIDLTGTRRVAGHASPRAVILVDPERGERTVFWSRGSLPAWDPAAVDVTWLDGATAFYTDGHDAAAAAVMAAEARRRGLPVIMDAGSVRAGSADLVAQATDVIGAEGFASRLTGQQDPVEALRAMAALGPERVATTLGAGGVLALVGDRPVVIPAFAVPVVDTTGAGDAFHAGYAFARALGRDFVASLSYGAAVAALKCTAWGGREGLPTRTEVEDLMTADIRLPARPIPGTGPRS